MNMIDDFAIKQRKYMPVFPKATGTPTQYIPGYPYEDEHPMPANEIHGVQAHTFFDQIYRYFQVDKNIHVSLDNFIYYREGDTTKVVAPDVYVVLGATQLPLRRSFYTWAEGAVPTVVFEFLSDATARQDEDEKVTVYLRDMGVQEYFIHQPDTERPEVFRGWRRRGPGDIIEIEPDASGALFSEALNLRLQWEYRPGEEIRLLRPYLPDGTPISTSIEMQHLKETAERQAETEAERRLAAEARAAEETARRQHAERVAAEAERIAAEAERVAAEAERVAAEAEQRRQADAAELERLRAELAKR